MEEKVRTFIQQHLQFNDNIEVLYQADSVTFYHVHKKQENTRVGFMLQFSNKTWPELEEQMRQLRFVDNAVRSDEVDFLLHNQKQIKALFQKKQESGVQLRQNKECARCDHWIFTPFPVYAFHQDGQQCVHDICISCWLCLTQCPVCDLPYFNK